MFNKIVGQNQAVGILKRLIAEDFSGRTLIFHGEKGVGKFTTALAFAGRILDKEPLLSTDFLFYRNDVFSLKSRYFIESNLTDSNRLKQAERYFHYLQGRISQGLYLGEFSGKSLSLVEYRTDNDSKPKKKSLSIQDFSSAFEETLLNGRLSGYLSMPNSPLATNIMSVSDALEKRKQIPIDYIRSAIEFHNTRALARYKVTLIGDFEQANVFAQNSALKLFEEPPATSVIIATTSRLDLILPTILSRSIIINFNRLNPEVLKSILGESNAGIYTTCGYMEEKVFQYSKNTKENVMRFFNDVAPKVQYGYTLFEFVEDITKDNQKVCLNFLEELGELFRNLHLIRQENLRQKDLSRYISATYRDKFQLISKNTSTSEIKTLSSKLGNIYTRLKYGNFKDKTLLPAFLLDISRWFQKKSK